MIALTQDMRVKLIKDCEFDIERLTSLTSEFPEETALQSVLLRQKVALASLTAAPCGYTYNRGYHAEILDVDLNDDVAIGVDLYTVPPVPEIKLPDDNSCEDGLKKHGLRTKSEGISQLSDGFRCGFAWHENEIKRLNGLGD